MSLKQKINPIKIKQWFESLPIAWKITGWYSIFLFLMLILLANFTINFISVLDNAETSLLVAVYYNKGQPIMHNQHLLRRHLGLA